MFTGSAVRMLEGRVLRRGVAGTTLLAVVLALSGGATMAIVAGGRRTATSYDRFVAWSDGFDARVNGSASGDPALADASLSAVAALPHVEASTRLLGIGDGVIVRGRLQAFTTLQPVAADLDAPAFGRIAVEQGRLPDRDAVDEAVLGFDTASRFGLHVGDAVTVVLDRWDEHPEWWVGTVDVQIVGIIALPGQFPSFTSEPGGVLVLTPAFRDAHAERVDWTNGDVAVRLHDGVTLEEFTAAVEAAGVPFDHIGTVEEDAVGVRRLLRTEAGALWILAAVIGVMSVVVVVQLFRRDVATSAADLITVRALGMPRREIAAAGALRGLLVGVIAAAGAVALAVALSPLLPRGVARVADPHPGVHADLVVLAIGVMGVVVLATLTGAVAVLWAVRRAMRVTKPLPLGRLVNRLPAAPAAGVRLALEAPRSGRPGDGRGGLLGLGAIALLLVGAVSVRASLDHLVADPDLAGRTWDMTFHIDDGSGLEEIGRLLDTDADVTGYTRGGWSMFSVAGRPVFGAYLEPSASVGVAVDEGRVPLADDEIVLGSAEMDALGAGIGDRVGVTAFGYDGTPLPTTVQATVVGRAVLAAPIYRPIGPGEGMAMTAGLARRLGGDALPAWSFFVEFRHGAPLLDTCAAIAERVGDPFWFPRTERSSAGSLVDLRSFLHLVMGLLVLLGAATLLHRLVSASRGQRHQLAVLRTLGFTDRQLLTAGAVGGTTLAVTTLVVAVPLGTLGAFIGWRRIARYLGVVARPTTSVVFDVLIAGGFVALAACAALGVVAHARRHSPGQVLRTE